MNDNRGQRAVGCLHSPDPSPEPPPPGWRHSQTVGRDKAGKVLRIRIREILVPPQGGGGRSGQRPAGHSSEPAVCWIPVTLWSCRRRRTSAASVTSSSGIPSAASALSMMDLELPPPGLQSQQVLLRPSGLSAVPGERAGARGEGSSGGRDSLNPDCDGRAGKATGM
ncbi:hypothetical protein ACRRTK_024125 [Alexandromys fortis]